jgi:hypothetical protein
VEVDVGVAAAAVRCGLAPILWFGMIVPDWVGTNISRPFSPTMYGTPADTGPPIARCLDSAW